MNFSFNSIANWFNKSSSDSKVNLVEESEKDIIEISEEKVEKNISEIREEKVITVKDSMKDKLGSNSIERREEIIQLVVNEFRKNFTGSGVSDFKNIVLELWVLDNVLCHSIKSTDVSKEILVKIDVELGYNLNGVEIMSGPLPSTMIGYKAIGDGIYISIKEVIQKSKLHKASISIYGNSGSLLEYEYILDAEEIVKLPEKRYNIGIGELSNMDDVIPRINNIVVDDNQDSEYFEKNKYVSRAHAHIYYDKGFLLQVEKGGTRISGKRTHLFREGSSIELNNLKAPILLKDGDIIILSKKVSLLFKAK